MDSYRVKCELLDGSIVLQEDELTETGSMADFGNQNEFKRGQKVSKKLQYKLLIDRNIIESKRDNRVIWAKLG